MFVNDIKAKINAALAVGADDIVGALLDRDADRLREAIRSQTMAMAGNYEICTSPTLESKIPLGAAAEMFNQFLRSDEYRWVRNMHAEGEMT